MIGKLSRLGLPDTFLDFLNSFLLTREGVVTVEGAKSEAMILSDMVFQGTVLGPMLWNSFFGDVAIEVPEGQQIMNLFADDLTAEIYHPQCSNPATVMEELREIQTRTHAWGVRNQVTFDASKEFFNIIHPSACQGDDFKMLGTLFDCRLCMQSCIEYVLTKARPKIRALLRLRHMFSVASLIGQYKTQIWGFSEYSNGVLIMASESQLRRLDKMQRWFLHELGISDSEAFGTYNFAPPSLRRRIGILGFLHKRTLGQCHPYLEIAFPLSTYPEGFHNRTLHSFVDEVVYHRRLYFRSIYGFIHIYNRLSQELVDSPSVNIFQTRLTHIAKVRAQSSDVRWRQAFADCVDVLANLHGL